MADYTKKFLDITGLTQLVKEIKNRIEAAQTASVIDSMSYDADSRKLSIAQGGKNDVANATLPLASSSNAGLMSTDQVAELARLNTAKLDKVALRIDGTTHATLFDTTTANGTVVSVVDYTTNVGEGAPVNQAPVASAVATALGTKLDSADFTAFYNGKDGVYDTKMASVDGLITDLSDDKLDKETYNTDKLAIENSITSGLAGKVDNKTYQDHLTAQAEKDLAQQEAINKHEAFLYTGNDTNIYTKTQVDDAIAEAKAAIVGGDDNAQLQETYKTLISISNWIESNDGADDAAGLTKDVAALKSTTSGHTTAIEGLQNSVKTIIGEDGNGGKVAVLASRLTTVENDLNTESTGIKARLTTVENDLNTATTGIKAKLATAEGKISTLEGKVSTAEGNITTLQGDVTTLTNNKAAKSEAFGSAEDLVWDATTNSYKLEFKSVSGATLDTVNFPVFTADDITALFNAE